MSVITFSSRAASCLSLILTSVAVEEMFKFFTEAKSRLLRHGQRRRGSPAGGSGEDGEEVGVDFVARGMGETGFGKDQGEQSHLRDPGHPASAYSSPGSTPAPASDTQAQSHQRADGGEQVSISISKLLRGRWKADVPLIDLGSTSNSRGEGR